MRALKNDLILFIKDVCVTAHTRRWRSQGTLRGLVLSFHQVGSGDQNQVFGLDIKCPCQPLREICCQLELGLNLDSVSTKNTEAV